MIGGVPGPWYVSVKPGTTSAGCLLGSAGNVNSHDTCKFAAFEVPIVVCGLLFVFCAFPHGPSQLMDAARAAGRRPRKPENRSRNPRIEIRSLRSAPP